MKANASPPPIAAPALFFWNGANKPAPIAAKVHTKTTIIPANPRSCNLDATIGTANPDATSVMDRSMSLIENRGITAF